MGNKRGRPSGSKNKKEITISSISEPTLHRSGLVRESSGQNNDDVIDRHRERGKQYFAFLCFTPCYSTYN